MPSRQKILVCFLIVFWFFIFSPSRIFAQVVINEFSSNSDPEWVELYNNSDSPIDISNWSLKDESQAPKSLAGIISGRGYFIFENVAGWLNNSGGDTIALFDNLPTPSQVDTVVYGQSDSVVETPNADKSAGRIPDGSSNWENQLTWTKLAANFSSPIPTPTTVPISTATPTPAPAANDYANISISEYLPYPESGENEWVELYNGNDFEVNLGGWYVDDVDGGGRSPKGISGTIPSRSYKQFFIDFEFFNNEGDVNNRGDDVRLLNASQVEKESISYESAIQGKSWSRGSQSRWCQTDPTPNAANPDCPTTGSTATSALTPTVTVFLMPTPSRKVTPMLTLAPQATPLVATASGEILGQESSPAAFYPWEATEEAESVLGESSSSPNRLLPLILLGVGFILLFSAAFWLWYTQLRNAN